MTDDRGVEPGSVRDKDFEFGRTFSAVIYPQLSIVPLASARRAGRRWGHGQGAPRPNAYPSPELDRAWRRLRGVGIDLPGYSGRGRHCRRCCWPGSGTSSPGALLYPIASRASAGGRGPGPAGGGRVRAPIVAGLRRRRRPAAVRRQRRGERGRDDAALGCRRRAGGHGPAVDDRLRLARWSVSGSRRGSAAGLAVGLGGVASWSGRLTGGRRCRGRVHRDRRVGRLGLRVGAEPPAPGARECDARRVDRDAGGGVVLLAVAAATGEFSRVDWSAVPATSWIALAYLIGPGLDPRLHRLRVRAVAPAGRPPSPPTPTSTRWSRAAGIAFLGEQFSWREGLGRRWWWPRSSSSVNRPHRASAPEHAGQPLTGSGRAAADPLMTHSLAPLKESHVPPPWQARRRRWPGTRLDAATRYSVAAAGLRAPTVGACHRTTSASG